MARPKARRPKKPNPNFPLFPHRSGSWTAVIDGRQRSFGGWSSDRTGELAKKRYDEFISARRENRLPRPVTGPISVEETFGKFLAAKAKEFDAGDIEAVHYADLKESLQSFANLVGAARPVADLRPEDFAKAYDHWRGKLSPRTVNRKTGNVRNAFRYAERNRLIDRAPWYGDAFEPVPIARIRRDSREREAENGKRVFTPDEIGKLLAVPVRADDYRKKVRLKKGEHFAVTINPQLRAMVLLGLNCGFLAVDCARLTRDALDLENRRLEFVRQKRETERTATLWPETVEALKAAIAARPEPADPAHAGLVFLTSGGVPWKSENVHRGTVGIKKVSRTDSINQDLGKLLRRLGIKRKGVNFASLRPTYRTAADETGDRNAVLLTMGHALPGMDAHYVRSIDRVRLDAIAQHVHSRLIPKVPTPPTDPARPKRPAPLSKTPRSPRRVRA